ncbi:SDR family NAD(P)-dependent oxidoreductase [Alcaligenes endophyticus]|uniref:SDR family NAD(P)-dependent oxidoreductase n=1 Tax=Alcaligenes endophyticus TaxID=1929088 RepID=A0ABT8EF22_9BURK|nr:SDR family NAD(P)-dependent oxidoreductase [Alcaligenes endophyticus]MCX5590458.1 SDR family NAD(P)-dependent oxidoreductase [Alcaligenes endophyticus]MDN4119878.1 SDR family NAD(P)-dependent oxidoreductase [Alcaligenes endophyticus]
MNQRLQNKVALVTGAGQGVGRAISLELAQDGAAVIVNDLFSERCDEVAQLIIENGGRAIAAPADITNMDQVETMVQNAEKTFGYINVLVNNAGIVPERREKGGKTPRFLEMPITDWSKVIDLNLYGSLYCSKSVLPRMVEHKDGKIINIISEAGRVGEANLAVYSAAKGAIAAFGKALAKEHGRDCITVNSVALGAVSHEGIINGPLHPDATPENNEVLKRMLNFYPLAKGLGRVSRPEDISGLIAFLASDRSLFITGQTIGISGGFTMI